MFRRAIKSSLTIAIAAVLSLGQVPAFAAPAAPSAPFKPQMSAPASAAQNQIAVTWLAPLDNPGAVTDYTIQYSATAGATWTTFTDGVSTTTSTSITGLAAGTTYSVRVRAESAAGSSAWAVASSKAERFETVAGGDGFTCAVLRDGTVQCWGLNSLGQLGDGTTINRPYVGYVTGITTAKSISVGVAHACVTLTNGEVWCWGSNSSGQLGNASLVDSSTPVRVVGLPAFATAVTAGSAHSCAVTTEGKVYCWGANGSGQLGLGDTVNRNQAGVAVTGLTGATAVAAGASHTCSVKSTGLVDCWGANAAGQLGNGTTSNSLTIVATGLTTASNISARGNTSCSALTTGSLYCWGENSFGEVGNNTLLNQSSPAVVTGVLNGDGISVGTNFVCAHAATNTIICWGKNANYQLGDGTTTNSKVPVTVLGVTAAASVGAAGAHACAVLTNGQLECWGSNLTGQLGKGNADPTATSPNAISLAGLSSIDAGDSHTCGVKTDGSIVCWGLNTSGELGNAEITNPGLPVLVLGISNAIAVSAGAHHTCAVLAAGAVKCWGANGFGQLGNGTTNDAASPVSVTLPAPAVSISAGRNHTCAVLNTGEARCWGLNSSGQLGHGDTVDSSTPIPVLPVNPLSADPAMLNIASISAGGSHTCAALADKSVVCFGSNLSGQLGDGTDVSNSRAIVAIATADAIAAGDSHTCALLASAVKCWGANASGQLGNGTSVASLTPVSVSTLTTATSIVAGTNHNCATLASGTAVCWGANGASQLGDATITNRTQPVAVLGATNLSMLAAGSAHSCSLTTAGALTCWGTNTNGERGNASLSNVALQLGAAPSAPTAVVGTSAPASAVISWTPGTSNGARILSYTVTSNPAGGTCTSTTGTSCTVTGLTNGRAYTFTVTATNQFGTSVSSGPSASVTPAGVPGAPTNVVASPGNTTATVTWLAPVDTGGSVVTGYTVTSTPASGGCSTIVGVGNATTCTVTGLTNLIGYTFVVTATNAVGTSVASVASATTTPLPFPDAPTAVNGVRGDLSVTVRWTPPVNNSDPVTSFVATASPGGATCTNVVGVPTANQCVITGLTNGTPYTFTVISRNASGSSPASAASSPVTPSGVPGSPVAVGAVRGNGSATVSWTAPDSNGAPILSYLVTSTDVGGFSCSTASTSCTVTGLTNGTTYQFTVVATNVAGNSLPSAVSNSVTPATTPGQPGTVTATAGDGTATVSWIASSPNGEPLTSYVVTAVPTVPPCTVTAAVSGLPTTCTFTGLTNGQSYYFTVQAFNLLGGSLASFASNSVTPAGRPFAPAFASAVRGDGSATVSWLAADNNGSAITSYTVTSTPGGKTCTTAGISCVVTGLTNGVSYTFTVSSTNAIGASLEVATTASVLVAGAPFAPTAVTTVDGDASMSVSWTAPADNGEPITHYTVTASPGGATCSTIVGIDATPTACTITGLTNGSEYTFTVTATNAAGTSVASAAVGGTPVAAPGAPTGVIAVRGDTQVSVSWTASVTTGGSAITGYLVTASPSGKTCSTATTSCTVTGLTNGVGQRFSVQAINRAGASVPSSSSGVVTPAGRPLQPVITTLTPGHHQMTVTWADNRSNGEAITSTVVVATPGGATCSATTGNSCTITGLTNGSRYTFVATASNALGDSVPSEASAQTMVGAVPYAPTSLIAEAGDRKVTVRWTAADGRDFSVLSYKVTSTPGGFVCTSEATSCIVTGLTNGVSYTFHVTAISVMGESLPSAESTTQIPAGPPLAPGLVTVVRGSGQAEVRWTAADGNGSDVTGYTVLASPGGRSCVTTTALMCVITGLTNGTEYTFAVSATSIVGTSLPRVSEVVVPAGVATAPISVKAIAGNKTATVSWKKPTNDGGAPITSYRVIASPGGATCVTETGDVLSCSITGLTNGTAYTFTVIAVNGIGNSLPSTASVAVTPSMKPYASTAVTVTMVAAGSVKLNWSGAKRNGATLLKYEYSFRPKSTAAWSAWKSVGTNTFVVLKALTKGKPYQLKVRITTSAGSATSKVLPFTPTK